MLLYPLGRLHAPDARDLRYRLATITKFHKLGFFRRYFGSKHWTPGPVLNQGTMPQCVGYSWAGFLQAEPLMTMDGPAPEDIYHLAQLNDEWPGQDYDGSSVRGGAKALSSLGNLVSYYWAEGASEVRDYVLSTGTVVVGTNWFFDMFFPVNGYLKVTGSHAGGHAWHVIGYSGFRRAFRMQNSWGSLWGDNGRAWIKFGDLDRLIKEGGEACAAVEQ